MKIKETKQNLIKILNEFKGKVVEIKARKPSLFGPIGKPFYTPVFLVDYVFSSLDTTTEEFSTLYFIDLRNYGLQETIEVRPQQAALKQIRVRKRWMRKPSRPLEAKFLEDFCYEWLRLHVNDVKSLSEETKALYLNGRPIVDPG